MRHPPRSVLLAVSADVTPLGSVTATDNTAVRRSWSPAFDLMGGQKLDQGRNAGCKLGDADGPTRRPLDVNRSGGECRRVPGDGIRGTAPADQP